VVDRIWQGLGSGEIKENSIMAKSNMLQNWYHNGITVGQRRLLWIVSVLLIMVFGVGLIPLAFLLYLHLGEHSSEKSSLDHFKNPFEE
jgi:hypothetical protein